MGSFQLYVFFLCLIVFIALTTLFSFMIFYIGKQRGIIIASGLEDDKIIKRLDKKLNKKVSKTGEIFEKIARIFSMVLCVFLCVLLIVVGVFSCKGEEKVNKIPAIKVIASTSMSECYENNKYLFENNLNNQLQMFDIVVLHELPKEEDLKLYDIVVYEHISGALLIHRIIGIEEPNESHPDERHFLLQGDAVHYPDSFPVRYSQMKSIYRGERIPNVGSFVYFVQSPAGIICIILFLASLILMPIADNFLMKKEYERVVVMVNDNQLDEKALDFYKYSKTKRSEQEAEEGGDVNE